MEYFWGQDNSSCVPHLSQTLHKRDSSSNSPGDRHVPLTHQLAASCPRPSGCHLLASKEVRADVKQHNSLEGDLLISRFRVPTRFPLLGRQTGLLTAPQLPPLGNLQTITRISRPKEIIRRGRSNPGPRWGDPGLRAARQAPHCCLTPTCQGSTSLAAALSLSLHFSTSLQTPVVFDVKLMSSVQLSQPNTFQTNSFPQKQVWHSKKWQVLLFTTHSCGTWAERILSPSGHSGEPAFLLLSPTIKLPPPFQPRAESLLKWTLFHTYFLQLPESLSCHAQEQAAASTI